MWCGCLSVVTEGVDRAARRGGGGDLVPLHVGTDTVHDLHGDEGRPGQMHLHRKRDLVAARIVVVLRMRE